LAFTLTHHFISLSFLYLIQFKWPNFFENCRVGHLNLLITAGIHRAKCSRD